MKNVHFVYLVSLLVLCSCAKPLISNLEKGTYKYGTAPADILDVSVSILPVAANVKEEDKPKTFFDLKDSLPYTYLRIMATKTRTANQLIKTLSDPLTADEKPQPKKLPTDYTLYKVRFAFSNLKKYYNNGNYMHPNTRLEFLTTSLSIPTSSKMRFYTIDKLENEFDEIDLGTLSRDQTVSLNAKLSVDGSLGTSYANAQSDKTTNTANIEKGKTKSVYDADGNVIGTLNNTGASNSTREASNDKSYNADAKVGAGGELGYLNSSNIKEAVAVKLRRLRTGFNFSGEKLTIAQRGRPLGDISDNIYVTATLNILDIGLELPVYAFENLYTENINPVEADKIKYSKRLVRYVPCINAQDVKLTTSFEGAVRVVENNGSNNALEFDDNVLYAKIATAAGAPLEIDKNLYCKDAYKVIAITINKTDTTRWVLKIADPVEMELDIFTDDSPEFLLQWVIDNIENPDKTKLNSKKFKLYFETEKGDVKQIYVVKDGMTDDDIKALKSLRGLKFEKRSR